MAINWIKMRVDLLTHPKVVRIASALDADTLRVVGGLMSVWCLFDAHTEDGRLEGYTVKSIDDYLRWPGFAEAMVAVGWIVFDDASAMLPRFCNHNGQSAKRRAQEAERKQLVRKTSARNADTESDKVRTREEKRREENINTDILAEAFSEHESGHSNGLSPDRRPAPNINPRPPVLMPLGEFDGIGFEGFRDYWHNHWIPARTAANPSKTPPTADTCREQLAEIARVLKELGQFNDESATQVLRDTIRSTWKDLNFTRYTKPQPNKQAPKSNPAKSFGRSFK